MVTGSRSCRSGKGDAMTNCEECAYYDYDPETDTNFCEADLDEDEMYRFLTSSVQNCPYYQLDNEYLIVRKQM